MFSAMFSGSFDSDDLEKMGFTHQDLVTKGLIKAPTDDGSVKWFLLYDFLPSRSSVKWLDGPINMAKNRPREKSKCTYWSWNSCNGLYPLETLKQGFDNRYTYVYQGYSTDHIKLAVNASTITADSRRKIKTEDIILAEFSYDCGDDPNYLVFTETALYQFVNHKIQNIIRYADIDDVDYTDKKVSVTTKDKNCVDLNVTPYSEDNEKSSIMLFNLLMDIKERVEKKTTA